MWAEVILAKDDVEKALKAFCPLKIDLGDGGHLALSSPCDLMLLADVGLTMRLSGEVHWPFLGVQIPVSVRSATLRMTPEIRKTSPGETLRFKLRLDDADVSMLPAMVGRSLVDVVNRKLDAEAVFGSWYFTRTLSHVFELPAAIASARAIALRANWGRVRITSEALVLAVSFQVDVESRGAGTVSASEPGVEASASNGSDPPT